MYIYCITHKKLDFIEKLGLIPCGVGENEYPVNYIQEKMVKIFLIKISTMVKSHFIIGYGKIN